MSEQKLTFDDVLIEPKFSSIVSRKDVNLSTNIGSLELRLPIISSNMDTVTGPAMAWAMKKAGGIGCLHRFMDLEQNKLNYCEGPSSTIVSIGLGEKELERAKVLYEVGADNFCIDVAHGAQMAVVNQVKALMKLYPNINLIVGNFASVRSIKEFESRLTSSEIPSAYKIGIGPGSACTTRIKTGVGYPQLSALIECAKEFPVIADGGMKTPGDIAKALAAGSIAVMLGGMLSGTSESPGLVRDASGNVVDPEYARINSAFKTYRGSASIESYEAQGKDDSWRCAEGESYKVPFKGPVSLVIKDIEGGLRSALSYVGATNLTEFKENGSFVTVSSSTKLENVAHGKY